MDRNMAVHPTAANEKKRMTASMRSTYLDISESCSLPSPLASKTCNWKPKETSESMIYVTNAVELDHRSTNGPKLISL